MIAALPGLARGGAARRSRALPVALLAGALLAGCDSPLMEVVTGGGSIKDLEVYAQQVMARKGGKIEELPPIEPYEPYEYQSAEAVDPFQPLFEQQQAEAKSSEAVRGGLQPDLNRPREELESYPLDSLRMLGTLQNSETLWGIVLSPDGVIHRVQPGNYMGKNYGKISLIAEDHIELTEIVPDGQGGWVEREAQLALSEQ